MKKAIIEGVLMLSRNVVLAILPVMIAGINTNAGTIQINWAVVGTVALLCILTGLNEFVHKLGKELEVESLTKGITRF